MSKIVVDQIQKSGGVALTLPTSDGTNGQFMKTDGAGNLVFGAGPVVDVISGLVAPEGKGIVGSLISHTDRNNTYSTGEWASSGPWTTFYSYQAHTDNNLIQFINMAFGDGMGNAGTSEQQFIGDFEGGLSRQLQFGVRQALVLNAYVLLTIPSQDFEHELRSPLLYIPLVL
mgnify:FL=1